MYCIDHLENIFDVMSYTCNVLRNSGYTEDEIQEYVSSSLELKHNLEILDLSKEYLEDCRDLFDDSDQSAQMNDCVCCSDSLSCDDDCEIYSHLTDEDVEYIYDSSLGHYRKRESWETDNAVDDVESYEEAYEGFSTCRNYRWDSSVYEDDNDYDYWKMGSYYESMKREDDQLYGETSYDPFNDQDDEDF